MPTIRPAKGIHITVPWSLVRNEIAAVIPVPKDRRSVFVVPWGGEDGAHRFTYIGTTDTDYDGPLDDPQITADDVAYLLARDQRRGDDDDHRGRHPRHVGRAAAARRGGQERAHRRPLPPALGARVAEPRGHRDRRQAHDVPPHGGRHGRPGRADPRPAAAGAGPSTCACTAPTDGTRPDIPKELGERYGADARDGARARARPIPTSRAPSSRACRTRAPRSSTRCGPRWRARVDDVLSRRTRARLLGTRRHRPPRPTTSRRSWRPSWAGRPTSAPARSRTYRGAGRRGTPRRRPPRDRARRAARSRPS